MLTNAVRSVRKWGLTPGRKLAPLGVEVGDRRGHLLTVVEKTELPLAHPVPGHLTVYSR